MIMTSGTDTDRNKLLCVFLSERLFVSVIQADLLCRVSQHFLMDDRSGVEYPIPRLFWGGYCLSEQ